MDSPANSSDSMEQVINREPTSGLSVNDASRPRSFWRSSRLALVLGFGGLLAIMALAGIDALRVLQQIRRQGDQIQRRYRAENRALNQIRADVYVSGTYVRDYLLDSDANRAETYRVKLEEVRKEMEAALESYGRQVAPAELEQWNALRTELTDYWGTLAPIFQWSSAERKSTGYPFLRDQVFPRRQNMLAIADRISAIGEQQQEVGNRQVVDLLLDFQNRLLLTLVAALILGFAMALFTMRRMLNLETQDRLRYEEVAHARSQLKALSARLDEAQETERRALSRELHDEVGQSLSAVLVELRNLSAGLTQRSAEQSRRHVETVKGLVENTIRVVRNMALLLRPSMLDDLGLIPALKWQARECGKRTSMDVTVDVGFETEVEDLPDEYKTCLYRVVQEALHNCARHSHAKTVRIRVAQEPDRLTLVISDDGRGFDAKNGKGLGLLGIEERVARLSGASKIQSHPGDGTTLSVELPLAPDRQISRTHEPDSHPVS
jgi:signal transduction histidine kinase